MSNKENPVHDFDHDFDVVAVRLYTKDKVFEKGTSVVLPDGREIHMVMTHDESASIMKVASVRECSFSHETGIELLWLSNVVIPDGFTCVSSGYFDGFFFLYLHVEDNPSKMAIARLASMTGEYIIMEIANT